MTDETMRAELRPCVYCGAPCRDVVLMRGGDHGWGDDASRTVQIYVGGDDAIAAERARCAEIARSMGENEGPDYRRACDDIAGAIEDE